MFILIFITIPWLFFPNFREDRIRYRIIGDRIGSDLIGSGGGKDGATHAVSCQTVVFVKDDGGIAQIPEQRLNLSRS